MRYLIIGGLCALLFSSCGAGFHLKRAKFHIARAEALGASIEAKSDTIIQYKEIEVPAVNSEVDVPFGVDTVYVTKDSIQFKIKVNEKTKRVYVHVLSKPKYFRVKETVYINRTTTIKAGF